MNFLEACRKFIEIESTLKSGNMEIIRFTSELCQSLGLYSEIQEELVDGRLFANIIIRPQIEKAPKEFMLQSHLDTVAPGEFVNWDKTAGNPFNSSIHGEKLYGLGASQAKLDFLCKLEAIKKFRDTIFTKEPYVLVGTFGIENKMAGTMRLIRRKKVNATKALIGAPTSLKIANAGPGTAVVEITIPFSDEEKDYHLKHDLMESSYTQSKIFHGKAAHSAHPNLGDNAIGKMLDYLDNLPEGIAVMELDGGVSFNSVPSHAVLEIDVVDEFKDTIISKLKKVNQAIKNFENEFSKYPDPGFTLPQTTMNVGRIKTNQNYIHMSGTCRVTPSVSKEVYEGWISTLKTSCEEVGASFIISDYKQPFNTDISSEFVKAAQGILGDIGSDINLIKYESTTEASLFSRVGIECLLFGPGVGVGNIHAPNEYVKIDQLEKATEFYRKVIERFCV